MSFMKKSWIESFVNRRIVMESGWKDRVGMLNFCRDIESRVIDSSAEVMKDDTAARVVAVPFNNCRLVIKQYRSKSWRTALSRSLRKSKAEKTWDNIRYLCRAGIDTVEPVALIDDRIGFFRIRSYFVCSYIAGYHARSFFNDPGKTPPERNAIAEKIVDSILEFHFRKIFIGDTKDTNIVISIDGVCWVDLDAVTIALWEWTAHRKSIKDWQIFLYNWRNNAAVLKLFLQMVSRKVNSKHYHKIIASSAFYFGKKFYSQKPKSGFPLMCDTGEIISEVKRIASGAAVFGWEKVQSSETAIVVKKKTKDGGVYCKVFLDRSRLEKVKRVFRPGRGIRVVKNEYMMRAAGLPVPETLFWGNHNGKDYIVSREIEGAQMVSWLDQKDHDLKYRRRVLNGFGEKIAALHQAGFAHGDLRLNNIILHQEGKQFEFYFLDNERTMLYKKIPRRWIIKNFRQINTDAVFRLSRTDRLRIFKAYQKFLGVFSKSCEKMILTEVERQTTKRLRASGRSGKAISMVLF